MLGDWLFWTLGGLLGLVSLLLAGWSLLADRSRGRKRCPKCWYDMTGITGDPPHTCPECGKVITRPRRLHRTRRRWRWAMVALVLLLIGSGLALTPKVRRDGWPSVMPDVVLILLLPYYAHEGDPANWCDGAYSELLDRLVDDDDELTDALSDWEWNLLIDVALGVAVQHTTNPDGTRTLKSPDGTRIFMDTYDDWRIPGVQMLDRSMSLGVVRRLGRMADFAEALPVEVTIDPEGEWPTDVPVYWWATVSATWADADDYHVVIDSVRVEQDGIPIVVPDNVVPTSFTKRVEWCTAGAPLLRPGRYTFHFDLSIDHAYYSWVKEWGPYCRLTQTHTLVIDGSVMDRLEPVQSREIDALLWESLGELRMHHSPFHRNGPRDVLDLYACLDDDTARHLKDLTVAFSYELRRNGESIVNRWSRVEDGYCPGGLETVIAHLWFTTEMGACVPSDDSPETWELIVRGTPAEAFRYARSGRCWDGELSIPLDWKSIYEHRTHGNWD